MKIHKAHSLFPHLYATHSLLILCFLFGLFPVLTQAQTIRGTVFRDFNADGLYTPITNPDSYTYGEPGVAGVIVTAYSANTATAPISATTNAAGAYTLTVGSTNPYRVEFTNVVAGDFEGFAGTNSRSNIRFVNGGTAGVNLGINYPAHYNGDTNPYLITSCYTNGDPISSPSSATSNPANDPWLVAWQYDGAGQGRNVYLSKGSIGSTWGLAYNRTNQQVLAAAFMKRHAGFGTGGPGQIYAINLSNPTSASTTVTPFVNLKTDLNIEVGTDPRLTDPLPTVKTTPNHDAAAFDLVGKMSLGDISLSDDDKTLWVVNLYDQALYQLPMGPNGTKPTTYTKHTLPNAGCVSGTLRPFATKFYRGKIYVGAVCTGESGGTASSLKALVYAHDPAGAASTFTQVLSFPLSYTRGYASSRGTNSGTGPAVAPAAWQPWISSWTSIPANLTRTAYDQTVYPQPVLSDIEFDSNGEMVLGLFDRFSHQTGNANYSPITSSTAVYEAASAGDLLRAGRQANGTYLIENNATVTNVPANNGIAVTTSSSAVNQSIPQGPGGGEFYWQDMYQLSESPTSTTATGGHQEITVGGLALLPERGQTVVTVYDPAAAFRAAGARYFNNHTGKTDFEYQVLAQDGGLTFAQRAATFGKAASLGDMELVSKQSPVQIGNRVWIDSNDNGVQDAGEPPLSGVAVTLKGPGLPSNGVSVVTNTDGEYYFSSGPGSTTVGYLYSLTGLTQGGSYTMSFPTSLSANAYGISRKPNAASGAQADAIDTDADSNGQISFTLGGAGENNFSFDVGFVPVASLGDYTFVDTNHNGVQDANDTPLAGVTVVLYNNGAAIATTTTDASGLYSFTGLAALSSYSYSVGFTTPAGYVITGSNAGDDALDSDADPITGRTQSVTLAAGQNDTSLDAGFYIPFASLGDYVFEDVNRDGIQDSGDLPIANVVVTLLQGGTVVQTTRTDANGLYYFAGLLPGQPYSVSFTTPAGFEGATSATVGTNRAIDSDPVNGLTAPITLTASENNITIDAGFVRPLPIPILTLAKTVSNKRPELGSIVTYTLTVSNPGPGLAAAGTILRDSLISGIALVPGSVVTSFGSATASAPGLLWDLSSLPASATVTMTYQASLTAEGVLFNYATIPGSSTTSVCLTVPIHLCAGVPFEFELSAPASFSAYQWSRNGQPIPGATSATLSVTAAGEYSVAAINSGGCSDGSCCPFVIVEDPLPSLSAVTQSARCVGTTPQNDAAITLVSSNSAAVTYNVSLGSSFTATVPLFSSPQPLSAVVGGILVANQPNPATPTDYTVRVYSANGCFTDTVVTLQPTVCACPPPRCAPIVVRKTKTGGVAVRP
ncbi:SdrD B-like domain-containing protein [Fibrella sp. WM1]|uniref:SdrD B-like domain-containing protein n=1 Tax=Fibrella musci TaxID=3242485 RepID=UPI003520BCD0